MQQEAAAAVPRALAPCIILKSGKFERGPSCIMLISFGRFESHLRSLMATSGGASGMPLSKGACCGGSSSTSSGSSTAPPSDACCLHLDWDELRSMVKMDAYHDFCTDYCNLVASIKTCTAVKTLCVTLHGDPSTWQTAYFVLNTLYQHLPKVQALTLTVQAGGLASSSGGGGGHTTTTTTRDEEDARLGQKTVQALRLLLQGTERFTSIHIHDTNEHETVFCFDWGWLQPHARLQELVLQAPAWASVGATVEALAPLRHLQTVHVQLSMLSETNHVVVGHNNNAEETQVFDQRERAAIPTFFGLPHLRQLCLENVRLESNETVQAFSQGLAASRLEDLKLSFECATLYQSDGLTEGLANATCLRHLHVVLTDNDDSVGSVVFPLKRLVRSNPALQTLHLQDFELEGDDVADLAQDMRMAASSENASTDETLPAPTFGLQKLDLKCGLDEASFCTLVAAARVHPHLKELTLRIDSVDPPSETVLCHVEELRNAPCLERLSLGRLLCNAGDSGRLSSEVDAVRSAQLVERLFTNYKLTAVSIGWLCEDSQVRCEVYSHLNQAGRGYLATPHRHSKAHAVHVLSRLQAQSTSDWYTLNAIYLHLQEHPNVCNLKKGRASFQEQQEEQDPSSRNSRRKRRADEMASS